MPLNKNYMKKCSECKVTFKISSEAAKQAKKASVVGEFNGWDSTSAPMKRLKDGSFYLSMRIPVGTVYQFRYLLDENTWINESEADCHVHCPYGNCQNSVLNLEESGKSQGPSHQYSRSSESGVSPDKNHGRI
jgi:1,4-alpha-glucan branching enzyme